jgi:hypothetical protein
MRQPLHSIGLAAKLPSSDSDDAVEADLDAVEIKLH